MDGMASACELSINVVIANKPNTLAGLPQKGDVAGTRSGFFLVMGTQRHRRRERA
jgi:hypothetical protein